MNIILDNDSAQPENINNQAKKENAIKPNLFQGNTQGGIDTAKFPEWDIVPPNQFINPRIKKQ